MLSTITTASSKERSIFMFIKKILSFWGRQIVMETPAYYFAIGVGVAQVQCQPHKGIALYIISISTPKRNPPRGIFRCFSIVKSSFPFSFLYCIMCVSFLIVQEVCP